MRKILTGLVLALGVALSPIPAMAAPAPSPVTVQTDPLGDTYGPAGSNDLVSANYRVTTTKRHHFLVIRYRLAAPPTGDASYSVTIRNGDKVGQITSGTSGDVDRLMSVSGAAETCPDSTVRVIGNVVIQRVVAWCVPTWRGALSALIVTYDKGQPIAFDSTPGETDVIRLRRP